MGCLRGLFFLIIGGFGLMLLLAVAGNNARNSANDSGVPEIAHACAQQKAELQAYLAKVEKLGFYEYSGGRHQVDEQGWAALTHAQKVNVAIAAFCTVATPRGAGVLVLYGLHDGKKKASMVDGNYFDS